MKAREIRDMTLQEIDKRISQLRQDHFGFRFQLSTGQLEQTNRIRDTKKEIARALTIRKEIESKQSAGK